MWSFEVIGFWAIVFKVKNCFVVDNFYMQLVLMVFCILIYPSTYLHDIVNIFLKIDSNMIGWILNFTFFFGAFSSGVRIPLLISWGYSPVSDVFWSSSAICWCNSFDPYLMYSDLMSSLPVLLLFLSFLAAFLISSSENGGSSFL